MLVPKFRTPRYVCTSWANAGRATNLPQPKTSSVWRRSHAVLSKPEPLGFSTSRTMVHATPEGVADPRDLCQ
jgi:hypothetical protein